jgi:hypothetical protein
MMEIPLFEENVPLRMERVVLYPYPDLRRIWTRIWLTAVEDQKPNIEITIYDPQGDENTSVFMMEHDEQRAETTLHLRNPQPGTTYRVVAELTRGIGDQMVLLEHREFDMALEFRNPERGDPGFGFGVDWDEVKRKAQQQ